jgi:aspartate 1-decarboxylase
MFRALMKSKLHRGRVTGANIDYMGSITIDADLMKMADLLANERVHVLDIDNGARFETYVLAGEPGSRQICLNGAAARLVQPGDKVIVLSYGLYTEEETRDHQPIVVLLDRDNEPQVLSRETAGTLLPEEWSGVYDETLPLLR